MAKLKTYILNNFIKSFITLFVPFFIIMSLIYIINISKLSSKITLEFQDFIILYLYVLPDIIFSTLPLTFLGAVINSLSNLSESNEAIAIFSVGYTPKKIANYLLPTAFLFTALITILAIFITPYTTQKMKNYRNKKIYESKLKILPKKLSQSFGKHHIFIDENIDGKFKNVTMFTQDRNGKTQILLAKSGYVYNDANSSYLNLDNGILYRNTKSGFSIIDYKNLKLYNNSKYYSKKILPPIEYWKKNIEKFYYFILISFSPLFLIYLYIAFGIYNPRYQKNLAALYIVISVLLVYIPAILIRRLENIYLLIAFLIGWIVISIIVFNKKVLKRY